MQAKKKLGQKLSQKLQLIPSKNRFKIQNNNPKNGASARGASVVVLNFVSVFCRNLLELLAELLAKFFLGLDFWTFSFDIFFDIFFCQKVVKTDKNLFGQIDFWIKKHG